MQGVLLKHKSLMRAVADYINMHEHGVPLVCNTDVFLSWISSAHMCVTGCTSWPCKHMVLRVLTGHPCRFDRLMQAAVMAVGGSVGYAQVRLPVLSACSACCKTSPCSQGLALRMRAFLSHTPPL